MSDFLNNLAARALQRREPVRPRLASRFEPPGGGLAALPAGPPDFETTVVEPAPHPPSTIRPDAPRDAPHTHTTPREPPPQAPPPAAPRRDDSAGEEAPARVEFSPAPTAPPRARVTNEKGRAPLAPSERGADAPPPERTPAETMRPVEVFRQEQRPAHAPETDARAGEASAGTWERVRELEGRVAALEASREREKGRRESLKPVPAAVTLAPRQAPPHAPAAAAPASGRGAESVDEPPHVTVTIGRVDVRAVFPAAAEAPRPVAAPRRAATTLAQYLEKRERGRR